VSERRPPEDLERELRELAAHIDWPGTPDLAGQVRRRLDSPPDLARRVRARIDGLGQRPVLPLRRLSWRAAAVLIVLVLAATVLALPGPRAAIADLLGIGGVRIERVPGPLPSPSPGPARSPIGDGLGLGRRVGLADARARVAYPVLVPTAPGFTSPDAVWLDEAVPGGAVSLVYRPRPGMRPAAGGVGLLLTTFQGELVPEFAKKMVQETTRLEEVRVGGATGLWIEGGPHFLLYQTRFGNIREEPGRLAGNTLLWTRDGLTLRLEAEVSRDEAIRIAESMR
jgi:hypothetical protein